MDSDSCLPTPAIPWEIHIEQTVVGYHPRGQSSANVVDPGMSSNRFRFGVFEADRQLGVLTRQGKRVALQDLPFRALIMLLERPGELITREDLHQQL